MLKHKHAMPIFISIFSILKSKFRHQIYFRGLKNGLR